MATNTAGMAFPLHADIASPARPQLSRILVLSTLAWAAVCLVQTLASYSDRIAAGHSPEFLALLRGNALLYIPWIVASVALHASLARSQASLMRVPVFLRYLLLGSLLFMVPYELYLVWLDMLDRNIPITEFPEQVRRQRAMTAFIDYILFLGCFAFLYATAVFQRSLADQRRKQRIEAENMALRLEAEKSRLAALQGQLEPHFLFNALNALSALVRGGERPLALAAIQQLSELLRYATSASEREWATVGEELAFVEQYIGLQLLRHGERLRFAVEGLDHVVQAVECPPLLLQPLVENALRHGLEATDGSCRIQMRFRRDGDRLDITVSNTTSAAATANPGLGVGLDNLRGRLALVYGDRASLATRDAGTCFEVDISLPADAGD